jgi:hypothetical protein
MSTETDDSSALAENPKTPGKDTGRRTRGALGRRSAATETTYRETEYIDWLSKNRIPVVIRLLEDEEARGWIEYYDRDVIRLTRSGTGESNLFIFKERVKYLYEDRGPIPHDRSESRSQRSRNAIGERGSAR